MLKSRMKSAQHVENSDLKELITAIHEKKRPEKCNLCSSAFAAKSNLRHHMRNMHNAHQKWNNANESNETKNIPASSVPLHLAAKCCFHNRTQAEPRFVSAASGFKTLTASLKRERDLCRITWKSLLSRRWVWVSVRAAYFTEINKICAHIRQFPLDWKCMSCMSIYNILILGST